MAKYTFPNQRTICIHRQKIEKDFLGIKNKNWKEASRNLKPHALLLYLYLASNSNNYKIALSPTAIRQEIGMARSTYHDQFNVLVDKGYLVLNSSNNYDFYEVPQTSSVAQEENEENSVSADGLNSDNYPTDDKLISSDVQDSTVGNIEINNTNNNKDKGVNNSADLYPRKEITIESPTIERKSIQNPKIDIEEIMRNFVF